MSPGVYLRLMGNIFVVGGAVKSDGLKVRIPLPFVVVHSGKTTKTRFGFCSSSVVRSTRLAFLGGWYCGFWKARQRAWNRDIRWTRRVDG